MLMWPSMVVLTGFLAIYLYKAYQAEKDNLKKEVGYLFVNAVNSIEGGLINQLMFRSDSFNNKFEFTTDIKADSVKVMVINAQEDQTIAHNGPHPLKILTQKKEIGPKGGITIKREISEDNRSLHQTEGVISLILRSSVNKGMSIDSLHRTLSTVNNISDSLKEKFDLNLQRAGIPIHYTLNQYADTGQVSWNEKNIAGTYHDLATNEKFDVLLQPEPWLILKKLWAEFFLALLLLACLGLAFYSMTTTIRREKNLLEAKSDFIQNMTHELKTPISTVRVALEALHEFDGINDVAKRDDYLRISRNELDRLSLLVDRVLSMSNIDRALPAAQKEIIPLTQLVTNITETLQLQTEKQHTRILIHQSEPDISLYADPQWVSGIVYNLLDNALKYSDKEEPQIDIYINKNQDQVELIVKDNGPGIGSDHQQKIFEKFYRVPRGNVHTVKGHGLGLAFVWRLVKEMGGVISIDSELGKGSVFNVILPAG